jgi:hypothetical protein
MIFGFSTSLEGFKLPAQSVGLEIYNMRPQDDDRGPTTDATRSCIIHELLNEMPPNPELPTVLIFRAGSRGGGV